MNNEKDFSNHCIQMFEVYSDYIDGDLDPNQKKEVEDHLCSCSECRSCIATLKKTRELCSNMPKTNAPHEFSKKLYSEVEKIMKDPNRNL